MNIGYYKSYGLLDSLKGLNKMPLVILIVSKKLYMDCILLISTVSISIDFNYRSYC
jgi:hypothetical protein